MSGRTRFLLVRHGQTEYNKNGSFLGDLDVCLSDTGRKQAMDLREAIASLGVPIPVVVSSPLMRAKETAQMISYRLGHHARIEIHNDLREMSFGLWEGKTSKEIEDSEDLVKWRARSPSPSTRPPGGENFQEVSKRVITVLNNLAEKYPQQTIVIVTHVYVIKAALDAVMDLQPGYHANRLFLDTGTVTVIDWSLEPEERLVRRINWGPSLEGDLERRSKKSGNL